MTKSCDSVPLNKIHYFLRFARFRPGLEILKPIVIKSSCLETGGIYIYLVYNSIFQGNPVVPASLTSKI